MKVSVHGFGKVGAPLCAVLLNHGFTVYVSDPILNPDKEVILPFIPYENMDSPYHAIAGEPHARLRHYSEAPTEMEFDASFIIVNTGSLPDNHFDHSDVIRAIKHAKDGNGTKRVIVISTLDPSHLEDIDLDVYYCPLMIALGDVYRGIETPSYQLLGLPTNGGYENDILRVFRLFQDKDTTYSVSSRTVAAWQKLLVNTYSSYKIAFFNEAWMSLQGQKISDEDCAAICRVASLDSRIGSWGSVPGTIPGGPCLPRDTRLFDKCCSAPVSKFIHESNDRMVGWWVDQLRPLTDLAIRGENYKQNVPIKEGSTATRVAAALERKCIEEEDSRLRTYGYEYVIDFNTGGTPKVREL